MWVIYHLYLLSLQSQLYAEQELQIASEIIVLVKSTFADLFEEFCLPKSTICQNLNVITPLMKCNSLKHLWDLIVIWDFKKEIFRKVIRIITTKNKIGRSTYLIREDGAHGLKKNTATYLIWNRYSIGQVNIINSVRFYQGMKSSITVQSLYLCVCYWPPIREVCSNNEVVMFQPWTLTTPEI